MSFLISGQAQEYLGFANYLVHQTLFQAKKAKTKVDTITSTPDNTKDYQIKGSFYTGSDEDRNADDTLNVLTGWVNTPQHQLVHNADGRDLYTNAKMTSYTTQNITDQIAADVAAVNTSNADITVTDIIFNISDGGDDGQSVYGSAWLKTGAPAASDAIDTAIYDKVIAAGAKVIHIGWNDLTDDNAHWLRTMARYEEATQVSVSDWDERKGHYARNIARCQTAFPTTSNDHTLNIDKILNKDATEYTNLCTFLGVSELSSATYRTYVDTYISAIS